MLSYTTSFKVNFGKSILPIKRLEVMNADDWEIFIEEWLEVKKQQYLEVERFGGAGDKGRDVVGYVTDKTRPDYSWDCYQCKHYDRPLMKSQMWVEFGKIIYYTYKKVYPVPRKYYFISPKGCGTSFSTFLTRPAEIKAEILTHWEKDIANEIISGTEISMDPVLKKYIENFDYTIFHRIQPKTIIEEHKAHANHVSWFGGGLPDREILDESQISSEIRAEEAVYVGKLVKAYASDTNMAYTSIDEIDQSTRHYRHFTRARINFHHAEQLRNFSRDNLPVGTFESFQDEVYDGVINIVDGDHKNDYARVMAVESHSSIIAITSNALKDVSNVKDKVGVCHQLSNNDRIDWSDNG
jgi:hypothetical protein